MARLDSKNIFIKFNEKIYKFINCKLEQKDGSFYISFIRNGENEESYILDSINMKPKLVQHEEARKKLKRVSYHASGCVIYHDTGLSSNYFEPISNITQLNPFSIWSIPSINALEETSKVNEEDYIIDTIIDEGRIDFHYILAPWNYKVEGNHIAIRYDNFFSLLIIPIKPLSNIPKEIEKAFTVMAPNEGLYKSQIIGNDQALINYHQKLMNTKDIIIYSPNKDGIYTIITSVPMRIPPKIKVIFLDPTLKIEEFGAAKNNVVKFKVIDSNNSYIKTEKSILSIELDSDF
ncbi:MAG: hypothetical protein PHG81_07125 [Aliarcobacter sp.]|nr:hypothetical protein [Aliarcobacter sp.]